MAEVAILGAGMMGSAMCFPLVDRGHTVHLVGTHLDDAIVDALRRREPHPTLGAQLPESVAVHDLSQFANAARGADAIVLGVSSAGIAWAGQRLKELGNDIPPVLMITKGLDLQSDKRLSILPDVIAQALAGRQQPVAVAGPCIAGELASRAPSAVVYTGRDASHVALFKGWLETSYYRVFEVTDVVGTEVCAAIKNAYAMAMAFPAGLHERQGGRAGSVALHNLEAATFAQCTFEMTKLVVALGGQAGTVSGLAGVGDLHVTCNGGRTGRFGKQLGLGLSLPDAIASMRGATLECLEILSVLRSALPELERSSNLHSKDLPLLEHMMATALDGSPVDIPLSAFFC